MTDDQTAKEHFQEAVDLSPDQRSAYLDEHCIDEGIRTQVQALLDAYDASTDLMDRPAKEHLHGDGSDAAALPFPRQLGDFRLIHEIGRGGMAIAYLAEELSLGRRVALKILPRTFSSSERSVARFRHEARAIARLHHPNIVPIYSVGEDDGVHYIAMEYVEGLSLSDKLKQTRDVIDQAHRSTRTKVGYLQETAMLIAQVADAVEHAHRCDIIHRDVKPANILIDATGKPRLADFGIAKNLSEESLTEPGDLAGTCRYMSPEQANAATSDVDHRTDIFSLGVVLYEATSLQVPFDGETPQEILSEVISKRPRRVSSYNPAISKDLETICHKAIEKDPKDRYQTAAHFAADLRCYVTGNPILARPPSLMRRARHILRSRRQVISLLVIIPVAATAAVSGYKIFTDDRPRLTINGDPRSIVQLRPIDVVNDSVEPPIKVAPIGSWRRKRLPPGYYRIIIEAPGEGFGEVARYLAPGQDVVVNVRLRSTTNVTEHGRFGEMVRIGSGEETIATLPRPLTEYQERVLRLPAFWIDRTEVSNMHYRMFLDATGRPPPDFWGEHYPPKKRRGVYESHEWDDLPVVGVTFLDAQGYAEWAGKRLLTSLEWERAARGPNGRLFPWGDDPRFDDHPANAYRADPEALESAVWREARPDKDYAAWTFQAMRTFYERNVFPVGDLRGTLDQTGEGVVHLFGNVMEWTETIPVESTGTAENILNHQRIVRSRPWGITRGEGSNVVWTMHGFVTRARIARGFRCAKSVNTAEKP